MEGGPGAAAETLGWENRVAFALGEHEETALLCALFEDLCAFYDLEYSLSVLRNETGGRGERDGPALLRRFGLDPADRARPWLLQLLEGEEPRGSKQSTPAAKADPPRSQAGSSRQTLPEALAEEEDNDIFLKESNALDLSVESGVEDQFDYAEEAELIV